MDATEKTAGPSAAIDLQTLVVRLGTGLVFLAAFVAATAGWYMIGGAYHFDMITWYWKCLFCAGWACAVTLAVHAALVRPKPFNAVTRCWLVTALLISIAMGSLTFYYHLLEPPEEGSTEEETAARL